MALSIGKVRIALLVAAALLLGVVVGFIGYARRIGRAFVHGIPARLGIDIKQTTDNFTYSQTIQGKTAYTIHASKAIEHTDGHVTLKDVGIVMYGHDGSRADHISGDEFDYDENHGIVSAAGEVQIDLQAPPPAAQGQPAAAKPGHPAPDARVIHVVTRGLIFDKNEGLATTSQEVDFSSGGVTGRALGAQYDSKNGVLVLDAAVHLSGLIKDRPGVLTAARAELDKAENKSVFTAAKYVSPGQGLVADHAVLHTTPDGTPQTLEADGHVVLTGNGDGSVRAPRMDAVMNEKGKLKSSHLSGGVRYADEANGRGSHGGSDEAWVNFDREGRAQHVLLTGAVSGEQRGLAATRSLSAARLELELTPDGNRTILQDAQATGSAKVREIALAKAEGKHSSTTTDMAGDTLLAHFEAVNGQAQIKSVHGMGHTLLHQLAEDGTDQTSTGNTLDMAFRPAEAAAAKTAVSGGGKPVKRPTQPIEIASAVQRGGIHVLRTLPPKPGASAEVQRASGDVETYDGDTDRVTLRGQAQVEDSTGSVYAEQVTLERASGDATASGGVRTTYLQARAEASGKSDSGNDDPTHVLADHASFQHDLGTAFFYGTPAKPARMWQATSQVQAPLLKVHQTEKKLIARGENTGDAVVVHAVMLTSSAKPEDNAAKPGAAPKSSKAPSLVHIASRVMVYSDLTRQVELTGKVRVEDSDGVMTADQALVYLTPAADGARQPKPVSAPQNGFLGGQVERIVATGNVQVDQPGRRAEGQQLVYTADDKTFVMTGTKSAPPKMISEGRGTDTPGTVAGTSLRFRSGDDSVLVTGGDGQTGPQRVKTETRVKADNKR